MITKIESCEAWTDNGVFTPWRICYYDKNGNWSGWQYYSDLEDAEYMVEIWKQVKGE